MGFFSKLFGGLHKTNAELNKKLSAINSGKLNNDFFEDLESLLISSDISVNATKQIMAKLKLSIKAQKIKNTNDVKNELKSIIAEILNTTEKTEIKYPCIIMVVGVNGVGKTTAIGKLAHMYKLQGKEVVLAAADTFRAAATEQLSEWAKRAAVKLIKYSEGADPAAVVFDAISSAKAKNIDIVIVDTAGRLQNKTSLMEELKKINRVILRSYPEAQHKNYIVLDATNGQNAISQVKYFNDAVTIDGIILTKLDGSAKGGVIISLAFEQNIPVLYVGVGENIDDLIPFNADEYANGLF
ncbi:MAG: signal recognition particle-docking protein FtsY [Clostridia bacterium]|jgi:fused signal recognition particle receptor|nr:signal recognition particle-docking protein FtsY [Clostridia bacterium]